MPTVVGKGSVYNLVANAWWVDIHDGWISVGGGWKFTGFVGVKVHCDCKHVMCNLTQMKPAKLQAMWHGCWYKHWHGTKQPSSRYSDTVRKLSLYHWSREWVVSGVATTVWCWFGTEGWYNNKQWECKCRAAKRIWSWRLCRNFLSTSPPGLGTCLTPSKIITPWDAILEPTEASYW